MRKFFRFTKNDLLSVIIALFTFALFVFLYKYTMLFDGLENSAINQRFFLRDPSEKPVKIQEGARLTKKNNRANKDIVILGIDEDTLRKFDEEGIQWPFPWTTHAKFINYVTTGNPSAIMFDIMFESHKEGQDKLAKAIAESNRTFLDYQFLSEETDTKYPDLAERINILDRVKFKVDPNDKTLPWVDEVLPPNPIVADKAKGLGFANILPDPDHFNRRMPLLIKFKGFYYPNIDLAVIMHYYGITPDDIEIKMGDYIKLKNIPIEKMTRPNPERTITIPIDNQGFIYINFIGQIGSFPHFPYYFFAREGTMEGNDSLKGKIALVAAYTIGMATDVHKSPYGDMFGIEHHANALNTILNQDFIIKLSDVQNILIMLCIALVLGYFLSRLSIISSILFTFFLILGYSITNYLFFDSKNVIIAFATPLMMIGTNFALIISFRLLTEQREKRYIRQTFSKFVSKSVVDELLRHPEKIKLGGDKKILTVLFSDIRGFTSISEKLTPEQLVDHLNEYLQAMTDIVIKYNGTLDKYVGDEVMAFWGAPVPQENHALLACKASLEMMSVLHRMNIDWIAKGKDALNIGIGLNSGDMIVGNMGSNSRMDYTLMGDNVNLGARLEGTNKVYGTAIIISEFTYEHVKDKVIVRELDLIKVKGKHLPVKIYELVDLVDDEVF
ncbi:MAG TPA: adenylate/guanylate cyclase domain-containing protein [Spirochaetota bacterium]